MRKPHHAPLFTIGLCLALLGSHGCAMDGLGRNDASKTAACPPTSSASPPSPAASDSPQASPSLTTIQTAHSEFKSALDRYLLDLEAIAKTPGDKRNSPDLPTVNYDEPKSRLADVKSGLEALCHSLPKLSDQDNKQKADQVFEQANKAITSMQDVILNPLSKENGINNTEELKQIQQKIPELKSDLEVQNNPGKYGEKTFAGIKTFLERQNKTLKEQIDQLQSLVASLPSSSPLPSNDSGTSSGTWPKPSLFQVLVAAILLILLGIGYTLFSRRERTGIDNGSDGDRRRKRRPPRPREFTSNQDQAIQQITAQIKALEVKFNSVIDSQTGMYSRMTKLEAELADQQRVGSEQTNFAFGEQVNQLRREVLDQGEKIKQLQSLLQQLSSQSNRSSPQSNRYLEQYPNTSPPVSPQFHAHIAPPAPPPLSEAQLMAQMYRQTPKQFQIVDTVALTEESQSNLWVGKNDSPQFESSGQGTYIIVSNLAGDKQNYYLVPKPEFRLNQQNLETLANFYGFSNSPKADCSINLTKLAIVSSQKKGVWKLEESGQLNFQEPVSC